jgi:hypothetical protein
MSSQETRGGSRAKGTVVLILLAAWFNGAVQAGDLQTLYRKVPATTRPGTTRPADEKPDVSEVGIERTPCYGTCPVYTLIIRSDGTFRYDGEKYVQRLGHHTGRIDRKEFDRLARFAIEIGFTQFTSYSRLVTDNPTVYTMIAVDGRLKIVMDYARAGPAKLLEFEAMIDKAIQDALWD